MQDIKVIDIRKIPKASKKYKSQLMGKSLATAKGHIFARIMDLPKKLSGEGTSIFQVIHSDKNATYGNRIIQLLDGRIEGYETKGV